MNKPLIIMAAFIILILIVVTGYWLGTADFTEELNLEEKSEAKEETSNEDNTE